MFELMIGTSDSGECSMLEVPEDEDVSREELWHESRLLWFLHLFLTLDLAQVTQSDWQIDLSFGDPSNFDT